MKTLSLNYTCICLYCGKISPANRSTKEYCSDKHSSLSRGGRFSIISPLARNEKGKLYNAKEVLDSAYRISGYCRSPIEGWSIAWEESMLETFGYQGPYPEDARMLVVAGYLINYVHVEEYSERFFEIKPIEKLTKEEKATAFFLSKLVRNEDE